jgi:hypothetical protein
VLFQVSGKFTGGEVLQARAIIAHDVLGARQILGPVTVAVLALMGAGDLAQARGGAGLGHCPFSGAADGGHVVTEIVQGGVMGIMAMAHHVELC